MLEKWINKVIEFFAIVSESDFDYGFVSGVLFALGIVILFLIIKLIFKIIFRIRRTKMILVKPKDGDGNIIIKVSAVEDAIREDLAKIYSLSINKIKIFRSKSAYFLLLNCNYNGNDGNLMEIRNIIREHLSVIFKDFFVVKNLKKIDISFNKVAYRKNETIGVENAEEVAVEAQEEVADKTENE